MGKRRNIKYGTCPYCGCDKAEKQSTWYYYCDFCGYEFDSNTENFDGFPTYLIDKKEENYGKELREIDRKLSRSKNGQIRKFPRKI